MEDIASRLKNRVQLTTDVPKVYLDATDESFGNDIYFAHLIKLLWRISR